VTIAATAGKLHWNYFLALERDLEVVSRYVEFSRPNFQVFSIELAHLLFAAASEVDVGNGVGNGVKSTIDPDVGNGVKSTIDPCKIKCYML
jgi:hypothetical protein